MGTSSEQTQCENMSPQEEKIMHQVEYYFGDNNLRRDKFLIGKIKENEEGWVTLEVLLTFNRLRALSDDPAVIVEAVSKSTSGLIEVADDKTKLRRSPHKPLPALDKAGLNERSAYVKGFPETATFTEILAFFDGTKYDQIQLQRNKDRTFRGNIFITFPTKDDAVAFITGDELQFNENKLTKEVKLSYHERTFKHLKEKAEKTNETGQSAESEKESKHRTIVKGSILRVDGCNKDTTREDLGGLFGKYGTISFTDYRRGETGGYLRFKEENDAVVAMEKVTENDAKAIVKGTELELKVLEGEEEAQYWEGLFKKLDEIRKDRLKPNNRNKGFKGGRQKRKFQHHNRNSGESKKQKTAD